MIKTMFLFLSFFTSMYSYADVKLVNGSFKNSIDDKYSVYTKDLRSLISGRAEGEYNIIISSLEEGNKAPNIINNSSFYICKVSSDICTQMDINRPILIAYHQIMDMEIRVISENKGVSAGFYFISFDLTIDKKEI